MEIRPYRQDKDIVIPIANLFHKSVHAIDTSFYTLEQKEVWSPTPPDYVFWEQRLIGKQLYLAIIDRKVVGFIEFDFDGHIDCTYTHPSYQGQGIASALYQHVLQIAISKKLPRLYVEASLVARSFFKKMGFEVIKKNELHRQGQTLINFDMEIFLDN